MLGLGYRTVKKKHIVYPLEKKRQIIRDADAVMSKLTPVYVPRASCGSFNINLIDLRIGIRLDLAAPQQAERTELDNAPAYRISPI